MTDERWGCGRCHNEGPLFPFTMAFQPIVDLAEMRIDGHEALVRGPFGESAESILAQVDDGSLYAFDQACRVKAIEMAARLGLDGRLNINFLPNAVYEPRACIRRTLAAAAANGFLLERLTFEFTENESITDTAHTRAIIEEYHRHHFKVALDDFGTGYSGLARLVELKPDIIKLDRQIIVDCDQDRTRFAIVASLVTLTSELGIKLVVEGVERIGEVEALRQAGVRYMQGFFFARPAFEAVVVSEAISWPARSPLAPASRLLSGPPPEGGIVPIRTNASVDCS
ncbi:EAL domain-containing protein [Rhodovastum atsumiense]|uniref:EAL domain-containing protein n=1 Tax=Rhodovastum atsumiense TaxID=504468 RepID=A0A5M6IZQ3_9PROT|nr:EAL domain-containing protein [Rhodovastum atsumiense]KAA5613824.1 EAL domain-containing protein [Rhodovastum atsumiense]CAH2601927.1 EAL domain-containing protein [Rhodovastum atsumiense]